MVCSLIIGQRTGRVLLCVIAQAHLPLLSAIRVRYVRLRTTDVQLLYGLDWIASAPLTVRLLTGVVGPDRIGIMVAWITVRHQIGSASAAYLAGVLRIEFGTYLEAFILPVVLLIAAALMVPFVGAGGRARSRRVAGTSHGSVS